MNPTTYRSRLAAARRAGEAIKLRNRRDHLDLIIGLALMLLSAISLATMPWWFPTIIGG